MKRIVFALALYLFAAPLYAAEVVNSGATNPVAPYGDYINFGTKIGSPGYGFRTNSGTIEFKNLTGSWGTLGGGVTYPINLEGGTQTTGILPITQGGIGTNTATLDTFAHTGTSTFPSGVWGSTGSLGVGTTTPATALHVIGGITVSGNVDGRDISADGTALDSHAADTTDPHGATLTQTAATIAGVASPYIAQTNGTGTGITLAGTSTVTGNATFAQEVAIGTTTLSSQNQFYGISNSLYTRGGTFLLDDSQQFLVDARTNPRGVTIGIARINMKAAIDGVRPLLIDVDAAGYGDIKGVAVQYKANNIVAGKTANVFEALVDSANATGGEIYGLALMKTGTGTINMTAVKALAGTKLVEQEVGTLINVDTGFKYSGSFTDISTALGTTSTNVQLFNANNDYIYIGHSVSFTSVEILLATLSSGQGIKPIWEYSQGSSVWATFTPIDGTNGFRQNGDVVLGTLSGWAVDTVNAVTNKYWIRCKRTNNASITIPVENIIQLIPGITYSWDENGNVSIKTVSGSNITVTGTSTLTGTITTNTGIWGTNFGVGTTVPSQKIHAVGNIQATGEFIEGVGTIQSTATLIPYIQLSSTANQIPASTAETLITYTHVDEQQKFTFTPTSGVITIPENGVYVYIAGGQCGKDSGTSARTLDMWIKKNDVDVARSSVRNSMNESTDTKVVIQNTGMRCVAGDTIKTYIAVSSTTNNPGLYATTPAVGPGIPSIIITMFKISD